MPNDRLSHTNLPEQPTTRDGYLKIISGTVLLIIIMLLAKQLKTPVRRKLYPVGQKTVAAGYAYYDVLEKLQSTDMERNSFGSFISGYIWINYSIVVSLSILIFLLLLFNPDFIKPFLPYLPFELNLSIYPVVRFGQLVEAFIIVAGISAAGISALMILGHGFSAIGDKHLNPSEVARCVKYLIPYDATELDCIAELAANEVSAYQAWSILPNALWAGAVAFVALDASFPLSFIGLMMVFVMLLTLRFIAVAQRFKLALLIQQAVTVMKRQRIHKD